MTDCHTSDSGAEDMRASWDWLFIHICVLLNIFFQVIILVVLQDQQLQDPRSPIGEYRVLRMLYQKADFLFFSSTKWTPTIGFLWLHFPLKCEVFRVKVGSFEVIVFNQKKKKAVLFGDQLLWSAVVLKKRVCLLFHSGA